MKKVVIDLSDPIDEDNGWLLLERQVINDRTLLCWFNPDTGYISISLFHQYSQPNDLSKRAVQSQWGYMTYFVDHIKTEIDATQYVNDFLTDLENGNTWWEGPAKVPTNH